MQKRIRYNADKVEELAQDASIKAIRDPEHTDWLILSPDNEPSFQEIVNALGIHPLIAEDIKSPDQLPKVETFDDYAFMTHPLFYSQHPQHPVHHYQVSHILGEHFLITFIPPEAENLIAPIYKRLQNHKSVSRTRHADYLLYLVLDSTIDGYLHIAEQYRDHIEEMEDELSATTKINPTEAIQAIKSNLRRLRKFSVFLKDVTHLLKNGNSHFIRNQNLLYWQDAHDHLLSFLSSLETMREMLRDLTELYQANLNTETNKVIKTLTLVASIFIPLTFIAGVYGMNFKHMPELDNPWAYPFILGVMLLVALLMLFYMRYKKWF